MQQQMENKGNTEQQEVPKELFVINDRLGFDVFLNKLQYFAENKLKVAINPNLLSETIFAEVRQENYFIMLEYDPNKMSHMIGTVMPQMTDMIDTVRKEQESPFDGITGSSSVEEKFEYPER